MALVHGGDTEGFLLEYGKQPLDFSANCNPLGIPQSVPGAIGAAALHADRYPDPLCRRLRGALSEKLGIPADYILCGNGAADLIFRLALAKRPKTALVTAPTFAEYALALETVGCSISSHLLAPETGFIVDESLLERITPALDILFLCNPNNPTGRTVDQALLRHVADRCQETGTLLVVDECFNGFLDAPAAHSLKPLLPQNDTLLILDAFTKLYGMAGVRLGYCMTRNTALLSAMREAGQPWGVSELAQAAGIAALGEDTYVSQARALVAEERAYLKKALHTLGITACWGEANYILFRADIRDLPQRLRQKGLLIRDCGNYEGLTAGYWRIAVRTHTENLALIAALQEILDINEKQGER